jgi:hypothetical protein
MTRSILVLGAALAASCGGADDKGTVARAAREKAELKARAEKYLTVGTPGVQVDPEKDLKDGRYVRVFVVGTSPVSTVLGVEEGLAIAREKAEESAKAELVKWLDAKVAIRKTATDEVLLLTEGDGTPGGPKEQGKKVERRTREYEETAAGLVRGLKLVAYEQKGAERKVICVYRWDAGPVPTPEAARGAAPAKPVEPAIPDKKVVIDDGP